MPAPRIAIAHQTIWVGDAIGNDILGMLRLLERCGFDVCLLCENAHPALRQACRVYAMDAPPAGLQLVLYHHSIHWEAGERFVRDFPGPVVVKYHNITPSRYFAPYSARYRAICDDARAQTQRLAQQANVVRWQSDSAYNSEELGEVGVSADRRGVVPPFNRIGQALRTVPTRRYDGGGPVFALFVGRRVPNKGHMHLLRTLAAWQDLFPERELRCRVIGAVDPELHVYYEELSALQAALGIGGRLEWLGHVSDDQLAELFRSSHLYLNLSEHEGFCVPVVEAQAVGLPVVTTDVSALADTVGPGQVALPLPQAPVDYDVVAGLAHRLCSEPQLRETVVGNGFANAWNRFTSHAIEDRFLEEMEPVLRSLPA